MPRADGGSMYRFWKLALLVLALASITIPARAQGFDPSAQSSGLWSYEARTVYLTNLEREKRGLAPLRWNQQLTHAARWFSWDSIANRPKGFCGHEDTNGEGPSDRASAFGYLGAAGAENAYCAPYLMDPKDAVSGWMNSQGHRDNILNGDFREIGVGYYDDGNSYITQDFGVDPVYAPVVIENEAPSTTSAAVSLYIYNGKSDGWGGFTGAQEMQVSNDACFSGAEWQPYQPRVNWQLFAGEEGWRTVYARTRDATGRTRTASDVIYYGAPGADALDDPAQFSTTAGEATLLGLDGGGLPRMQFSLNWLADDTVQTFEKKWGSGQRVNDPAAWGGTAYQMTTSDTGTWVWNTDFLRDVPLVAYVRLKVADNRGAQPAVSLSITGGEPRTLNANDFAQANAYQEFALPFTFPGDETFLIINFDMQSDVDVWVDAVTFFTAPVPIQPEYTWQVPGGNYRGQGIWVRYVDDALDQFSPLQDAGMLAPRLAALPSALRETAMLNRGDYTWSIRVQQACGSGAGWTLASSAGWLRAAVDGDRIHLQVTPNALGPGTHTATLTITPLGDYASGPLEVPVQIDTIEPKQQFFLPFALH